MGASSSKRPVLIAFFFLACGGSTPAPASTDTQERAQGTAHESGDSEASASDDSTEPSAPPRATCDDGTCAPCGDALCPTGWYCDQTAPSGPSCGWLPECAPKSSCACIKKALGCSCEEKNGGLYLSCK